MQSPYLTSPVRILRTADVLSRRGDSRSKMYRDIKAGLFPKPVNIGMQAVGWPEHEVEALLRARIAGSSEDDMRTLVSRLATQRLATGV